MLVGAHTDVPLTLTFIAELSDVFESLTSVYLITQIYFEAIGRLLCLGFVRIDEYSSIRALWMSNNEL